jgi:protein required for attachment to host cells
MSKIIIDPEAWVLVCDGRRALYLQNDGDRKALNLRLKRQGEAGESDATHELGTHPPGRQQNRTGPTSAVEQTDFHTQAEQQFARETAEAVNAMVLGKEIRHLVVVAPPRTLAELRKTFSKQTQAVVTAEVDKDLTNHPVDRIEALLRAA